MDIKEARDTAYNWIEETFIDKLSGNEENNDEYNLANEMGFNKYQVDIDSCWPENFELADELNMSCDDIQISFEKKSRNSGKTSFKMKNFHHENMELVLELYENILYRHYLEKNLIFLRGGTAWVRGLVNDGWFIYDKGKKEFWFFSPRFSVCDKKIENDTGSFMLEVSLDCFECIDAVNVISQAKEKYSNEPEVLKWIIEQVILGKNRKPQID